MRRCAFLTLADPTGYVIDDALAHDPLRALGWEVEWVPWDRPGVDWRRYQMVVIRSTWDYQDAPERFLEVLDIIERSGTPLENTLALVRWNLRKSYLRELAGRGVPVPPTLWRDRLDAGGLARLFEAVGSDQIVLKPVVSANAQGAFRLHRRDAAAWASDVERYYADRPLMAQPMVHSVIDPGEYSLFYFDGEYSHAVLKTPKAGDFRVQEEHGGIITAVTPEDALRTAGDLTLAATPGDPLYARADFVRANGHGGWWLMELEVIEPALYLRMDRDAPARFARALDARAARG